MKVLIVYHYIAHYRLPIFETLSASEKINFYFAAGTETDQKIKIVNKEQLDYISLENKWFVKRKLLWQKGIISLVFKNYDHFVFLGNPFFLSTWVSLILCKLKRKKASIWTHGITKKLSTSKKIILKLLWSLSDKIFVYGNYAKREMIKYGVNQEKIVVVYNSLDYEKQLEVRYKLTNTNIFKEHFGNEFSTFIFTGRLTKVKKLHLVLQAMKILHQDGVYCNLVLVGDGRAKGELLELAESLGLIKSVWFYGPSYDEKVIGELYYNACACVSPGNVGLTAMHALVYGTPVLTHSDFANQMPEFEAIEDGTTGSFFIRDNILDISNKMRFWASMDNVTFVKNRKQCYQIIDSKYNPIVQKQIFEKIFLS